MTLKELYKTPVTDVILAIEAYSILEDSYIDSGLEDPYIDDDWSI